jgi:ethanolamine permease
MLCANILVLVAYWSFALCIAELTTAFPFTGGASIFSQAALNSAYSTFVGYSYLFGYAQLLAGMLILFGSWSCLLLGIPSEGVQVIAIGALVLLLSVYFQLRTNRIFILAFAMGIMCVLLLLGCVLISLSHLDPEHWKDYVLLSPARVTTEGAVSAMDNSTTIDTMNVQSDGFLPYGFEGVLKALPFSLWFFSGIEMVPCLAEETSQSEINGPRGIFAAMITSTVLSTIVTVAFPMVSPGAKGLIHSLHPILHSVFTLSTDPTNSLPPLPPTHSTLDLVAFKSLQIVCLLFTLAGVHSAWFAFSRNVYSLSRVGSLPTSFSITSITPCIPERALVVSACLSIFFAFVVQVSSQSTLESFLFLKFSYILQSLSGHIVIFVSFILLRRKLPSLPRPFVNRSGPKGAALGFVLCALMLLACFVYQDKFRLAVGWMACGSLGIVPYYFVYVKYRRTKMPDKIFVKAHLARILKRKMDTIAPRPSVNGRPQGRRNSVMDSSSADHSTSSMQGPGRRGSVSSMNNSTSSIHGDHRRVSVSTPVDRRRKSISTL